MKLEVGQFIRTNYGIRKIVNITKDDGYGKSRVKVIKLDGFLNTGYKFNYEFYTDEKIIKECKSRFNIIDLVQNGDYVNGVEVINIDDEWITMSDTQVPILKSIANGMIKTIVTKEQMEQMAYKVGE